MSERDLEVAAMLGELVAQVKGTNARIDMVIVRQDTQNGSIQRHFADDAKWMREHDLTHAKAKGVSDGFAAARAETSTRDRWIIGGLAGGIASLFPILIPQLLERL